MGAARSALKRTLQAPVQSGRQIGKILDSAPKMAPKHGTTKDLLEAAKVENQGKFDLYNKRSDEYLDLLKQIRVDSVHVNAEKKMKSEDTTLSAVEETGKLTSEQLVFLFQQRMLNPDEWNEEKIAAHFKLPLNSVKNLLKYYGDFTVQPAPKVPEPLAEITY